MNKILIANRGEIACRIIETCKKLNIYTIAVYSDADKKAKHVRLADESIHIGKSKAQESYLSIKTILMQLSNLKLMQFIQDSVFYQKMKNLLNMLLTLELNG